MSDCCESLTPHIIGSAFSLILASGESPVNEGGLPVVNPIAWVVGLKLVGTSTISIVGAWVSTGQLVGGLPVYSMKFEQADTTAWLKGEYAVRLVYTAPDLRVFEQETNMQIEVKK